MTGRGEPSSWVSPREILPLNGQSVLIETHEDPPLDVEVNDDGISVRYHVAEFRIVEPADEGQAPYEWHGDGPLRWFGDEAVRWRPIPG